MTRTTTDVTGQEPGRGLSLGAALGTAAVALVVLVGAIVTLASGSDADRQRAAAADMGSSAAPPLDLTTVAETTAAHYLAAEANPATYRHVPCFCGCEEFLGHRHLYDCFVRADDLGWDAHASGCGVCIAESVTVGAMLDEGQDIATIRDAVIAKYGATTLTTAPTSSRS